jgi:Ca2+-binding EF-hand superfamily protein
MKVLSAFIVLVFLAFAYAQDYAEYARGAGMQRKRNSRGPLLTAIVAALCGGAVGTWLKGRSAQKKYSKEKKDLLQYMQLQDEIYKQREAQWNKEYQKLYSAYAELEKETVERDYEEFKAPDTDGDDMISRTEFNTYVRKYLSSFPELSEKDFPKFEEFDLDHDGHVSFEEWQKFLVQQKLMEQQKAKGTEKSNTAYDELLAALYEQSNQADSFNSLQKNIAAGSRGQAGGRRA